MTHHHPVMMAPCAKNKNKTKMSFQIIIKIIFLNFFSLKNLTFLSISIVYNTKLMIITI
jgi:hypothetical protein